MIGYAKKREKVIRESAFDKKKKKPGLALTGVRTTGLWFLFWHPLVFYIRRCLVYQTELVLIYMEALTDN